MGSNKLENDGMVSFEISVEGKKIKDDIEVLSIEVKTECNQVSKVQVLILDGSASKQNFELSSSNTFVPGNNIEIKAGYNSNNNTIFKGIISGQTIKIDQAQGSILEVNCHDQAIKTTIGRKSRTFIDRTDAEIMGSIVGNYSGITAEIEDTSPKLPHSVQYHFTDWDFLCSRAKANGMVISNINGKLVVRKPENKSKPVLNLSYGDNILSFKADLNALTQLATIKTTSWDYSGQSLQSNLLDNKSSGPGNLSSKKLSAVVGLNEFELQTPGHLSKEELDKWGEGQMMKSSFSKIRGMVECQGTHHVVLGNYITLGGLGSRFNGDHFVSKVRNSIAEGNWITEITIGLPAELNDQTANLSIVPASGLAPKINGLFTGKVKQIHEDPTNQYRILVDISLFDDNSEGIWARYSSFYASNGAGAFFMPEIDDEVVVGFLNDDPNFPIVLGSLYSSTKLNPAIGLEANTKNSNKAIVSKSGIQINLDDESKMMKISTPANNTITLDDKAKKILVEDENGNQISMSNKGIAIASNKDIKMTAGGAISINGKDKLTFKSESDVQINGVNINLSADMQFLAKGTASTSISSLGQLTVNGAMVMIN